MVQKPYCGPALAMVFSCVSCILNEYYHISARLHLSQITLLPSRAWTNIKGNSVILHSCQSITTSGASPPHEKKPSPTHTHHPTLTAIFNDFPKTHSGFCGTMCHSGEVKWGIWSLLSCLLVWAITRSPSPLMIHMYLPWARGGCVN